MPSQQTRTVGRDASVSSSGSKRSARILVVYLKKSPTSDEVGNTWTVNDIMHEVNEQRRLIKLLPAKSNKYSDPEQKAQLINRLLSARSKTHFTNDQDDIDSPTNTQNNTHNSANYPTTAFLTEDLENIDYSNNYSMNTNSKTNMSFSNRAIEMNKQHELTLINRDKLKEEYEKEYIKQTCTFQPLLSHKSNQLALIHRRRSRSRSPTTTTRTSTTTSTTNPDLNAPNDDVISSPEEIFTRLHAEANEKLHQLSILQAQNDKERMSVFTFQPTILPSRTRSRSVSPSSVKGRQIRTSVTDLHYTVDTSVNLTNASPLPPPPPAPPIYERIADLQKDRVKRLQQLAQSVDRISSSELTFEPKINALSRHIIAQKADRAAILLHTTTPSSSSFTHTQQYQHTLPTSTPTPSPLPPPPVPAVAPAPAVVAPLDVASRLINEGRLIELKRRSLKIQLDDAHKNDFRPSALSKGTVMMAATNPLLQ